MIPAVRQQSIIDYLVQAKTAGITELARHLHVSHMTIRRDIQKLEQAGWVLSVAGGVRLAGEDTRQAPRIDKWTTDMSVQKKALALEAEKLLRPGSAVFLDAGTTCLALAQRIAESGRAHEKLLVVTNDLVSASYLTENSPCSVFFAGGMVERDTRSCVSDAAAGMLRSVNIDIAFIAPVAWNSRWVSVPNADKALVKKTVVNAAEQSVLMSDSSKYGRGSAFKAIPIEEFDLVLSDEGLEREAVDALSALGVKLTLARLGE